MIKDKIDEIINMLIETTKSGDLVWKEIGGSGSKFNNEKILLSIGEDPDTKFEMTIKYSLSEIGWSLDSSPSLWIKNTDLPGGQLLIGSYKSPKVLNLRELLIKSYCQSMSPSVDIIENKLDDIYKSISKSKYRDNKISDLLK